MTWKRERGRNGNIIVTHNDNKEWPFLHTVVHAFLNFRGMDAMPLILRSRCMHALISVCWIFLLLWSINYCMISVALFNLTAQPKKKCMLVIRIEWYLQKLPCMYNFNSDISTVVLYIIDLRVKTVLRLNSGGEARNSTSPHEQCYPLIRDKLSIT